MNTELLPAGQPFPYVFNFDFFLPLSRLHHKQQSARCMFLGGRIDHPTIVGNSEHFLLSSTLDLLA